MVSEYIQLKLESKTIDNIGNYQKQTIRVREKKFIILLKDINFKRGVWRNAAHKVLLHVVSYKKVLLIFSRMKEYICVEVYV